MEGRRKPEYLKFVEANSPSPKTRLVEVRSGRSNALLGAIYWKNTWRQYTFFPSANTTFNPDCLREIADRCASMSKQHREALALR